MSGARGVEKRPPEEDEEDPVPPTACIFMPCVALESVGLLFPPIATHFIASISPVPRPRRCFSILCLRTLSIVGASSDPSFIIFCTTDGLRFFGTDDGGTSLDFLLLPKK